MCFLKEFLMCTFRLLPYCHYFNLKIYCKYRMYKAGIEFKIVVYIIFYNIIPKIYIYFYLKIE